MMLRKALHSSFSANQRRAIQLAQGRLKEREPVAVIDLGSNSVRQVIYEGQTRSPSVLFSEKILCGLGRGLAETNRLHPEGRSRALAAITRFGLLAAEMHLTSLTMVATAAVNEVTSCVA